jgi:hypothetical protein
MHDNDETQKFVGQLACAATALGALRVGLEIPSDEQAHIDKFLGSAGTPPDRQALLSGEFWTREFQDGRSSTAMAALLESLRKLARGGSDVKVVAFDIPSSVHDGDRDEAMAKNLAASFVREPEAVFLVLVGNLHARKAARMRFKQTFMAQYLIQMKQPVTTLDGRYGVGTSWVCAPTCQPQLIGRGPAMPVGIVLERTQDDAYDGTFSVGAPTFAPPAARPLTAEQRRRAELVPVELEAQRAYDKEFTRCGEQHAQLAQRDTGRTADHAYDAACCFAHGGDVARAFLYLGRAIDAGYKDRAWLQRDPDLAVLHGDARWEPLFARLAAAPATK